MYFEELRNQYATLKEQLKKQEIVSDRLIRETMKMKNKDISSTKRMVYVCAVFALFLYPMNLYAQAWSTPFTIVTCLMILGCAVATWYIHKPVDNLNFMRDDFSTVARVMAKFKKQYNDWLHYVTPTLLIPWILWACHDFAWKNAPEGTSPWVLAVLTLPLLIGAVIGGIIGYYFHRKAVNAARDIINEIEKV